MIGEFLCFWFDFICSRLGFPTCDRFADCDNKKCAIFNSRYYSPGSSAIDAFTQNWSVYFNWLVPPIHLIIRTIQHLQFCHVPLWHSSQFWPILKFHINQKPLHVKRMLSLGNIFIPGKNKKTIFGSNRWSSESLAILLDFRVQYS